MSIFQRYKRAVSSYIIQYIRLCNNSIARCRMFLKVDSLISADDSICLFCCIYQCFAIGIGIMLGKNFIICFPLAYSNSNGITDTKMYSGFDCNMAWNQNFITVFRKCSSTKDASAFSKFICQSLQFAIESLIRYYIGEVPKVAIAVKKAADNSTPIIVTTIRVRFFTSS